MNKIINKYADKIANQGLADRNNIILISLDAEKSSNMPISEISPELPAVFDLMNISSLLYAEPSEPYKSIIAFLAEEAEEFFIPSDCETRTFLHDIPVIREFSAGEISRVLSRRKAAIIGGRGIISYGTVSPEQAFVSFSSVCFSTFVKFFTDLMFHLEDSEAGKVKRNSRMLDTFEAISSSAAYPLPHCTGIPASAPLSEEEVYKQIIITGRELVNRRLVDSYFGNISYTLGETIYISQTGSSLDELETCLDAVPLDGSSSSGITASSELSAHINIFRKTGRRAIVHGHPKFTVIQSMSCRKDGCDLSKCYRSCVESRNLFGVPVVSGEIGTGPTGLLNTVAGAMDRSDSVIVFGHGIFSASHDSFRPAFELMQNAEERCMDEYFAKIRRLI